MIRVEFVPVKDLIEPVKLFMTEGGVIMPYERQNMLIITDYTDSAARILDIIHMLDNSYLDPDLVELIKDPKQRFRGRRRRPEKDLRLRDEGFRDRNFVRFAGPPQRHFCGGRLQAKPRRNAALDRENSTPNRAEIFRPMYMWSKIRPHLRLP